MSLTPGEFAKLRDYVYRKTGLYFTEQKLYYVERRVAERMQETGHTDFRGYFAYLRFDPAGTEFQHLVNALTVNETYFFREYSQLKCFAEEVLPDLIARKNSGARRLRVWCAGCATGEEAYTLAIILQEMTDGLEPPVGWEVHATDINTRSLERARCGVYDARSVRCVPEPYLKRYFTIQGNRYRVNELLRSGVHFYQLNLADRDAMRRMQNFDAIFCRNVLIYFDDNSRREVALGFYDSLVDGGYIFLGHSESMSRITPVFKLKKLQQGFVYYK